MSGNVQSVFEKQTPCTLILLPWAYHPMGGGQSLVFLSRGWPLRVLLSFTIICTIAASKVLRGSPHAPVAVELGVPLPLNLVYPAGAEELRVEKSLVRGRRGGLVGVLRRFWVVSDPEIGFKTPVNQQIGGFGNECAKSILFEQSRVELVKNRAFGKDEPTAFNAFLTMRRTQLSRVTLGTNGRSRAF
jgi:hypothetical protein